MKTNVIFCFFFFFYLCHLTRYIRLLIYIFFHIFSYALPSPPPAIYSLSPSTLPLRYTLWSINTARLYYYHTAIWSFFPHLPPLSPSYLSLHSSSQFLVFNHFIPDFLLISSSTRELSRTTWRCSFSSATSPSSPLPSHSPPPAPSSTTW